MAEYLTAEQVLAEVDAFCENHGNPQIARAIRHHYEKHGVIVGAAMTSLKLEKVVLYRRKETDNQPVAEVDRLLAEMAEIERILREADDRALMHYWRHRAKGAPGPRGPTTVVNLTREVIGMLEWERDIADQEAGRQGPTIEDGL